MQDTTAMKQDITMAWIDKLPAEPFNELVTQLEAINLLNKGPSVTLIALQPPLGV